uniref:(northern house mosquito) hypothetical protein n=1 Tax=Culex pipiens TaxID=7175 RepID=A0A8D8BDR4_CULPI
MKLVLIGRLTSRASNAVQFVSFSGCFAHLPSENFYPRFRYILTLGGAVVWGHLPQPAVCACVTRRILTVCSIIFPQVSAAIAITRGGPPVARRPPSARRGSTSWDARPPTPRLEPAVSTLCEPAVETGSSVRSAWTPATLPGLRRDAPARHVSSMSCTTRPTTSSCAPRRW